MVIGGTIAMTATVMTVITAIGTIRAMTGIIATTVSGITIAMATIRVGVRAYARGSVPPWGGDVFGFSDFSFAGGTTFAGLIIT
jgi:hypothetical protein